MKKTLLWTLILCFVFSLLPFNTFATKIIESGKCGDNAEWTLYSDGLLIISGTGGMYGDPIGGGSPFARDDRIKSVEIKDGITEIGQGAFYDCASLSSIIIPDSVIKIGNRAFYECQHLQAIDLPQGITSLEEGAFQGCSGLKSFSIPNGVKYISDFLFHCCSGLQTIVIPDGIESIGKYSFDMCHSLKSVIIPESVTEIGRDAFGLCNGLSELSLKTKTVSLGPDAFSGCFSLQDILYVGSSTDWKQLDTSFGNDVRIHYNVKDFENHLMITQIIESTCSSTGYSLFSCDCGYKDQICRPTLLSNNHEWDAGSVMVAPTDEREGIRTYTCKLCGATKIESIPKLSPFDPTNPFIDVKQGAYYYDPVLWAVNHQPQITNGTAVNTFSPDATCTRGQVVTFLWRAKGCPEPKSTNNPFTDVKEGAYYYKAVLWANENDITNGTGATTFSPESPCTRAHVVTFLWRTANKPAAANSNPFKDVPAGQYYTNAVLWAVNHKPQITNGTGTDTFSPNAPCTRGQIATFLYRYMK